MSLIEDLLKSLGTNLKNFKSYILFLNKAKNVRPYLETSRKQKTPRKLESTKNKLNKSKLNRLVKDKRQRPSLS